MHSEKDDLYANPQLDIANFAFDKNVVEVFPDMIQRSIPGYPVILDNIGQLALQYAQPHTHIYDLGCSLGAVSLSIQRYITDASCKLVGIDNSPAMVERCMLHLKGYKSQLESEVICADIQEAKLSNASVVVLNFTLQFVPVERRQAIIDKVYDALVPGGVLIISEKMKDESNQGNELLIELHHEFKRRNGYSDLEISQKRTALENVMLIDTYAQHTERMKRAGFKTQVKWYQCFNFSSFIAIK